MISLKLKGVEEVCFFAAKINYVTLLSDDGKPSEMEICPSFTDGQTNVGIHLPIDVAGGLTLDLVKIIRKNCPKQWDAIKLLLPVKPGKK